MSFVNVEIKARCGSPDAVRKVLNERKATFKGMDRQVDTYFNVGNGRLKLREGDIERSLIHYCREDGLGPKKSIVTLYHPAPNSSLKEILTEALGVLAVVEKTREIYFIGNVKFHVDTVARLGSFVEIEAIDADGTFGQKVLRTQCEEFMNLLGVRPTDLIRHSYCDMILRLVAPRKEPALAKPPHAAVPRREPALAKLPHAQSHIPTPDRPAPVAVRPERRRRRDPARRAKKTPAA